MIVVAVMLMAVSQAGGASPPPPGDLPVSVEHVREGLQREASKIPALKIPAVEVLPVFRASVEVDLPLDSPLQAVRRELAAESGYQERAFNILDAVMGIVRGVKSAWRAHTEAEIWKEVQAALNAFCDQHDCSVMSGPPPLEGIILPRAARPSP